jgi:hypothetical protein
MPGPGWVRAPAVEVSRPRGKVACSSTARPLGTLLAFSTMRSVPRSTVPSTEPGCPQPRSIGPLACLGRTRMASRRPSFDGHSLPHTCSFTSTTSS